MRIPSPERFAVHKLLVSQLRTGREAKSDEDVLQASALLAVPGEHHPGAIEAALEELPISARRRVGVARRLVQPHLRLHPRAWEELMLGADADHR